MAPILQELDREWAELATSSRARRALMRWVNTNPDLAGNDDLGEVLACRRDPVRSQPVLRALALLAPDDEIAARTLLQMMLPGLITLAARAGNDDEAAIDEIISLAWERIRTYPCQRTSSVAANIILDVRKRYRSHRCIEVPDSIELGADPVLRSEPDALCIQAGQRSAGRRGCRPWGTGRDDGTLRRRDRHLQEPCVAPNR